MVPITDGNTTDADHTTLSLRRKIERMRISPKPYKRRFLFKDKFNKAPRGNKNTIAPAKSSQALV